MPKLSEGLKTPSDPRGLITNVVKIWKRLKKMFKENHPLNALTTLIDNPDLSVEGVGPNFKSWQTVGLKRVYDLYSDGNFKTFESLRDQYKLPTNDFYKYLQVRHYVSKKANTLNLSRGTHMLERFFLKQPKHDHFISRFYSELQNLNLDKFAPLRTLWCTLLKVTIDKETWEEVLMLPSRISVCNRY